MKRITIIFFAIFAILNACSPMKSSPKEEKHQLELTLHEVQTNLDDLKHDINCFQTEMQIIDGKIKHQEDALQNLKQQHLEKLQSKLDFIAKQITSLDNKSTIFHFNPSSTSGTFEAKAVIEELKTGKTYSWKDSSFEPKDILELKLPELPAPVSYKVTFHLDDRLAYQNSFHDVSGLF